jgi:hypothetical protein
VHRANVIQRKGLLVQLKAPHALKPFVRQHLDRFELVPQANPTEAPITRTIDERPECHYPTAAPAQLRAASKEDYQELLRTSILTTPTLESYQPIMWKEPEDYGPQVHRDLVSGQMRTLRRY